MSQGGFLLDEHVPPIIQALLEKLEPEIQVWAIGDGFAPPKGTPDPDILAWIKAHGCLLITNNRASMPQHLSGHLAQGQHVPGIVQLPRRMNIHAIADDLLLIWGASLPDEYQDRIVYLPILR